MASRAFINDMLIAHNEYRKNHGVLPLKINRDLSKSAQEWANNLARTNRFEHSKDRNYRGEPIGENLSMKWTSTNDEYTGAQATKQWYDEVSKYNFRTGSGPGTGHFTQLVWKGSRELGVGKAQTRDGKWIAVAHYYPSGNYIGENKENVFPAGTKAPSSGSRSISSGGCFKRFCRGCCPPKASASKTHDVPIIQTREFRPFHHDTQSGKPLEYRSTTFHDTNPGGGGGHRYQRTTPPGGQVTGYHKTIVTETVIQPDGTKKVTTREVTNNDVNDTRFGNLQTHRQVNIPAGATRVAPTPQQKPQKMKDFVTDIVKTHNKYRKLHGKVGDLKHNKELSILAQSWAERLASSPGIEHSNALYRGQEVGENIAQKWSNYGADYRGNEVVEQWYNEVSKYDFGSTAYRQGAGHFSQIVWKNSKEIGVGKASNSEGRVFVVANYWPPGNVLGQFQNNVYPTKK